MGLDGQVGVKTSELENVFFFSLQGPLPLLFFQEVLQIYIVQCCKRARLAGREISEGVGAIICRSPISPPISFPGLTLKRG